MYVAENTIQSASVEFLRLRKNYARGGLRAFSNGNPAKRFSFESVSKNTFLTRSKFARRMLRRAIFMLLSSDFMQNILHFVPLFLHFGHEPQLCVRAVEILPRAVDAEVNIAVDVIL